MFKKVNPSSGKVSSILLILAVMLLVLIVGVFIFIKFGATKKTAVQPNTTADQGPPPPVYEAQVGNVKFIVESAQDLGKVIKSTNGYQQNLTTTERFIKVIVGAQNKGKENTQQGAWDVGNIIDSEGRNFVSINNQAYFYLPPQNLCGAILKPEFEFTPCIKLYEVSRQSKGLKIKVNATPAAGSNKKEELLDL